MPWTELVITSTAQYAEKLSDLLHEHGALSVSLEDAANQPLFQILPEESPLWSETKVNALFAEHTNVERIVTQLQQELKHAVLDYHITQLEEQDWVRQTQQNFPPQCFAERLWVIPGWCETAHYSNPVVKIDPGLAFGTGTHPTTALCLEWLAQHPPHDLTVIDYGCGSGILSLAALASGAAKVIAIDHDAQAIQATHNNAKLNPDYTQHLQITSEPQALQKSDLIIANILTKPLLELTETFYTLMNKNGTLLLSGILKTEVNQIATTYGKNFRLQSAKTCDEWTRILLKRV